MRVEELRPVWRVLVMGAALLAMGCATLPAPGRGEPHGAAEVGREEYEARAHAAPPHAEGTSQEKRARVRLRRRYGASGVGMGVAVVSAREEARRQAAGAQSTPQAPPSCGGQGVPAGWPDYSSWWDEELLAPFFQCASPGEFLALQGRVDMPRLVEALGDWSAVRLGALGPMEAPAAAVLQRKRLSFLINASRLYGAYAQVLTLFLFDTAFDDEVGELLVLLARDKQLQQTVGKLEAVREALGRRGFQLSDYPEREEQLKDVVRGLGRAAGDVGATIPAGDGARGGGVYATRAHLPPPYQEAFDETERALTREHFAPGHVALGTFDTLTFGVPVGFYHLAVGMGHGVQALTQGQYEQATRELAPAGLLVGLYAGGKGVGALTESVGRAGAVRRGVAPRVLEVRLRALGEVAERLRQRLGEEGVGQLAVYLRAQREAAVLVGVGGERAALALHEARGNVARAQAWLSQARPEPPGPARPTAGGGKSPGGAAWVAEEAGGATPKRAGARSSPGSLASLVDDSVGHSAEVVHARLARAELLEGPGARLPGDVAWLEQNRPALEAPPPGVHGGSALWREYVAYREGRLSELKAGERAPGPLRWEGYERLRGWFARGMAFERGMVAQLRADAALPRAQRVWLRDFVNPRIETCVGVAKQGQPGVRFADVLVIEQQPPTGQPPRVESFSFKSRDLRLLDQEAVAALMKADAKDALRYYGETLNIRRPVLEYLGPEVQIRRVRLIYEGGELKPKKPEALQTAMEEVRSTVKGVEVLVQ
jgi:hypothetical protein